MRIVNVHERTYGVPSGAAGPFIDDLGSPRDRLWPRRNWPPMILEGGLVPGSAGGHGPVRYVVERYEPGRAAVFRFTRPRGWSGVHAFTIHRLAANETRLRHVLEMDATGVGLLLWIGAFRPLHDAVIEEALDRAGAALIGSVPPAPAWSRYVRFLRWALGPRRTGSGP
jgi:hypothetical protein